MPQAKELFEQIFTLSESELKNVTDEYRRKLSEVNELISNKLQERERYEGVIKLCESIKRNRELAARHQQLDQHNHYYRSGLLQKHKKNYSNMSIADACSDIMLDLNGRPLHIHELVNRLIAGGFPFRTDNPKASVEAVLRREREIFQLLRPQRWVLVEREKK